MPYERLVMIDALFATERLLSLVGVLVILGVAVGFSNNRSLIRWRLVLSALTIQIALGIIILKTGIGQAFFGSTSHVFEVLYQFAGHGSSFVFGALANAEGPWGMIFAVKVLPTIIFFGAFMALLYHIGVVQFFVTGLSMAIRPILGTSGAETLAVAANVMLGQTEAPLLIKNYLPRMTESEMLVVMVGGMSHLSGSLLAVYGGMGVPISHLLTSSFMAIPAAIMIAKILIPETDTPETLGGSPMNMERETKNVLDAVSRGTTDGLSLAVNVAAMLISFISLMAFIDFVLGWATGSFLSTPITLNFLFGKLFYGVAYILG
ncbi:NupC/NupG family nucleoside CNT transporter, partial [Candidatus Dependentiae bacterium]|nr:NupC/NupG family nucleoside CNT transporter [Candidatus Dependentiae bacterium]